MHDPRHPGGGALATGTSFLYKDLNSPGRHIPSVFGQSLPSKAVDISYYKYLIHNKIKRGSLFKRTMIVSIFSLTFGCCFLISSFTMLYALPTTYDQRQDGNLNLAAKLENIMVVVALPGRKKPPSSSSYNEALESYLTLAMNEQGIPLRNTNHQSSSEEIYGEEDDSEEQESALPSDPSSPTEETQKDKDNDAPRPPRSIPSNLNEQSPGNLFDNELPSGEQENGNNQTGEHNEVLESFVDGPLKLIGDGIEDCGPERRRDSYGVCQTYTE